MSEISEKKLDYLIESLSRGRDGRSNVSDDMRSAAEALIELRDRRAEGEAEGQWRDLALQFGGHRIDALSMLRYAVRQIEEYQIVRDILREPLDKLRQFLASPPLSGSEVLANRIKGIALQNAIEDNKNQ